MAFQHLKQKNSRKSVFLFVNSNLNNRFRNAGTISPPSRVEAGFTLLEVLVVLALIGVLMGLALPNLARYLDSLTYQSTWRSVQAEVNQLPVRAFESGRALQLDAKTAREVLPALPSDWRIDVGSGVAYRASGWCEGGTVTITASSGEQRRWQLRAPQCSVS
jgi:prepilin-type N-terminal cleavage/methylation domain-containing protein